MMQMIIITDKPFSSAAASVLLPLILATALFSCGLSTGAPIDQKAQQLDSRFVQQTQKQPPPLIQHPASRPMSPPPQQQPQAPMRQQSQQLSSYSPRVQDAPQVSPRWSKPLQQHQPEMTSVGGPHVSEHGSVLEGGYNEFEPYQGGQSASQMDRHEATNGHLSLMEPAGSKHGKFNNGDSSRAEKDDKKKPTKEQKRLKKKLLELAEKATSLPENAEFLKFNKETNQLEPVTENPYANEFKQKLHDALKTIAAKKLSTERLKEALGIDDDDDDDNDDDQNEHETAHGGVSRMVRAKNEAPQASRRNDVEDELSFSDQSSAPYHEEDQPLYHTKEGFEHETDDLLDDLYSEPSDVSEHSSEHHQQEEYYDNAASSFYEPSLHSDESPFEPGERQHQDEDPSADQLDLDSIQYIRNLLGDRLSRISDLLYFSPEFLNQLPLLSDQNLTPMEAQFKRMVLCNSDEQFCYQYLPHDAISNDDALSAHEGRRQLEPEEQVYSRDLSGNPSEEEWYHKQHSDEQPHGRGHHPSGSPHSDSPPSPFVLPSQNPAALYQPASAFASVAPRRFSHSKSSTYYSYNHAREDAHYDNQTPQSHSFAHSVASVDEGNSNGANSFTDSHSQASITPTSYAVAGAFAGVKPDPNGPNGPPTQFNSIKVRQQSPPAQPQSRPQQEHQQERAPSVATMKAVQNVHQHASQQPSPHQTTISSSGPQQHPQRVAHHHHQPAPQHQQQAAGLRQVLVGPPPSARASSPTPQQQQAPSRPMQRQQQPQQANSPARQPNSVQVPPKQPLAGQYQAQQQQQQPQMIVQAQAYPALRVSG